MLCFVKSALKRYLIRLSCIQRSREFSKRAGPQTLYFEIKASNVLQTTNQPYMSSNYENTDQAMTADLTTNYVTQTNT